ncbi:MAG: DNA polymerase III subunit gamma/tau [Bacteroidales bacterium]
MDKFIVSARKYRPTTFDGLVGQENIALTLKNSILKGQLAHAYLFCGPRGVGKTSAARIFAKTINCFEPGEKMEPCGKCESCLAFDQGRSFSIHELDAASNNSVEDIRELNEQVRIPPQVGKYKVFIIDEVHMLSLSAFNAFLKTLEEPPPNVIFILATTEKHKILPTILSRCQVYDFKRISIEDIISNLKIIAEKESIEIEPEALHIIAQKGDGAMRDALSIFDQAVAFCGEKISYEKIISTLNLLDYHYYLKLSNYFYKGEHTAPLLLFDEIVVKGYSTLHFIAGLSTHFRDLLVAKESSTHPLLELPPTIKEEYIATAQTLPYSFLYEALNISGNCEAGYKSSGNPRLHIEIALLNLSRLGEKFSSKSQKEEQIKSDDSVPQHSLKVEVPQGQIQPQPQPISVAEPQGQPQPSPTPSLSKSSFSIKDLLATAKEEIESKSLNSLEAKGSKEREDHPFSEGELEQAWRAMAESEKEFPRLSNAILQSKPVVTDDTHITFLVANEGQRNWIESNCHHRLLSFLRSNLKNSTIELAIQVQEESSVDEKKIYMPHEKAKFLTDKYPQVKELQNDLKLELE